METKTHRKLLIADDQRTEILKITAGSTLLAIFPHLIIIVMVGKYIPDNFKWWAAFLIPGLSIFIGYLTLMITPLTRRLKIYLLLFGVNSSLILVSIILGTLIVMVKNSSWGTWFLFSVGLLAVIVSFCEGYKYRQYKFLSSRAYFENNGGIDRNNGLWKIFYSLNYRLPEELEESQDLWKNVIHWVGPLMPALGYLLNWSLNKNTEYSFLITIIFSLGAVASEWFSKFFMLYREVGKMEEEIGRKIYIPGPDEQLKTDVQVPFQQIIPQSEYSLKTRYQEMLKNITEYPDTSGSMVESFIIFSAIWLGIEYKKTIIEFVAPFLLGVLFIVSLNFFGQFRKIEDAAGESQNRTFVAFVRKADILFGIFAFITIFPPDFIKFWIWIFLAGFHGAQITVIIANEIRRKKRYKITDFYPQNGESSEL